MWLPGLTSTNPYHFFITRASHGIAAEGSGVRVEESYGKIVQGRGCSSQIVGDE
jgi:hypothetical protein